MAKAVNATPFAAATPCATSCKSNSRPNASHNRRAVQRGGIIVPLYANAAAVTICSRKPAMYGRRLSMRKPKSCRRYELCPALRLPPVEIRTARALSPQ
jgi:hypothetical protein